MTSIWGATDRGPAVGTMRLPTDTGAASAPGYLTVTELSTFFWASAVLVTPNLGTPSAGVLTNCTGTAAGLTAGNVTTNANLTGAITSVGNAASLGSFSSAALAAALTDETGSGAAVFGTSPTITGGTITGLTGIAAVAVGKAGTIPAATYVSGRFYFGGPLGCTLTAANTTPIVDNTVYASIGFAAAPITIKSLSFRTSSTSANVGASIKIAIYAADGANGTPGTLLGSTAAGTAVADAATTTDIKINLDLPTAVPAGPFFIAVLQTSTTGLRFQELTGPVSYGQVLGTDTNVHLFAGTPINLGYTVAQAYASGMPSPFGTAVLNTTPGLSIAFVYEIN